MMDRVLETCSIPVACVQLLAVTCVLVASKLEVQQPVQVRPFDGVLAGRTGGQLMHGKLRRGMESKVHTRYQTHL